MGLEKEMMVTGLTARRQEITDAITRGETIILTRNTPDNRFAVMLPYAEWERLKEAADVVRSAIPYLREGAEHLADQGEMESYDEALNVMERALKV